MLRGLDHRNIALLCREVEEESKERHLVKSFLEVCDRKGVKKASEGIIRTKYGGGEIVSEEHQSKYADNIRQCVEQFITNNKSVTAFIATSELRSRVAINTIMKIGMRVPDDISVLNIEDNPRQAYGDPIPITALARPVVSVTEQAVDKLLEMIKGDSDGERLIFKSTLVTRKSVAKARNTSGL